MKLLTVSKLLYSIIALKLTIIIHMIEKMKIAKRANKANVIVLNLVHI
jgi:hypothetical protein